MQKTQQKTNQGEASAVESAVVLDHLALSSLSIGEYVWVGLDLAQQKKRSVEKQTELASIFGFASSFFLL
jgi:hypothetical protein